MLSKILISALLILQTGFVAADDTSGRKGLGIDARGLLVRQTSTCPAGSFMCSDGTGCCDIGTTCGFRLSDNYPICKGGSCNGGPVCQSGLCCDLGYECNESSKLCQKTTGSNGTGPSDSPTLSSTPVSTRTSTKSTRTSTKSAPISSITPIGDDESEDPATDPTTDEAEPTDEVESTTRSSPATRFTPPPTPTNVLDSSSVGSAPPLGSGAEALSAVVKVVVGAVAGVLAFVF